VTRAPRKLLLHGDFQRLYSGGGPRYVSAVTRFCATLISALRAWPEHYVPVVFFCGSHVERDDPHRDGRAMVRSFIAQLLRYGTVGSGPVEFDGELRRAQERDGGADVKSVLQAVAQGKDIKTSRLCGLLAWLVRRLPRGVTLVCLVEGVSHYETDDHEDDLLRVLGRLLGLMRDKSVTAVVKVLATSATTTDSVQAAFVTDDDDESSCLLSLAETRPTGQGANALLFEEDSDGSSDDSRVTPP